MDQAFMFSVLNEQEKEIVTMAMEEKKFEFFFFFFNIFYRPGDWVIK